jgi:4-amino-4-deoxy-L-arabinose transferase-like glycosyltransferase
MEQILATVRNKKTTKVRTQNLSISLESKLVPVFVCLAFIVRFIFIPQNTVINGDGIYYATLGRKLIDGDLNGGISAYWSPLYSLLVGFSALIFDDLEFAGRFVSIIAGALLIIPAYFLIRSFFSHLPAYYGIILLTIHPLLIKSSGWVMTESIYTLIFTTGILVAWYALSDGNLKMFFVTGVIFGAAYLTKPEAIGFVGLLFMLTIGAKFFRRNITLLRYIAGYLFLLIGFISIFLPYVIYLKQKTGSWTISQKIMVNFPAADFDGDFLKLMSDGKLTMQDRVWGDDYETISQPMIVSAQDSPPVSAPDIDILTRLRTTISVLGLKAVTLFEKQIKDYLPELIPYLFVMIAMIGLFYKPWTHERAAGELFLFSFVVCTLIGYSISAVELRYLFPLIPILICWVANGVIALSDWLSKTLPMVSRTSRTVNPITCQFAILLFLASLLLTSFALHFTPHSIKNIPLEEKQAGLWIRNNKNTDSPLMVMSSHATPAFYAGAKHIFVPNEEFPTVLQYALNRKVDYFVYSQRRVENTPNAFPVDTQNLPSGIKIVYQDQQTPDYNVIIYQILN